MPACLQKKQYFCIMIEQALEFLNTHVEGVLATVDGDRPCLRAFQIMKQEGTTLFFATSERKEVYRQLRQNPRAEFLVIHDRVSVRCSGRTDFDVDDADKRWIYDHNEVLRRLYPSYDTMAYFRLPIERMDYYDLRPTPPIHKSFDLATGDVRDGFVGARFSK